MKTVLCGPPHSGKSCLRDGLKKAIQGIPGTPYPYFITAAPDGEGSWFHETAGNDRDLANALKASYKTGLFSLEYVGLIVDSVRACSQPLTLIDIGGQVTDENAVICSAASHAIILYRSVSNLPEWREFCALCGLAVIAEIHSDRDATADRPL